MPLESVDLGLNARGKGTVDVMLLVLFGLCKVTMDNLALF